jgi:hypothetical protein
MTTLHLIHHLMITSPSVAAYWQHLNVLQHMSGMFGYFTDNGTPDAPHFQMIYEGNALQSFLLAAQDSAHGCWASVAQGC